MIFYNKNQKPFTTRPRPKGLGKARRRRQQNIARTHNPFELETKKVYVNIARFCSIISILDTKLYIKLLRRNYFSV
jgi:hypothetical protein